MFNEFGNPFDATYNHYASTMRNMCKQIARAYDELSVIELRALSQCFCDEINGVFAEAILLKQVNMRKAKKNADKSGRG